MPTHLVIANHLDLSTKSVQTFLSKTQLDHKSLSLDEIRIVYIRSLREKASGRSGDGDLDLAQERARLAIAQTERLELQNLITKRELVPVSWITHGLSSAASKIIAILDTIPGRCKRMSDKLTAQDVMVIEKEIAKARNEMATLSIDDIIADLPSEEPEELIDA